MKRIKEFMKKYPCGSTVTITFYEGKTLPNINLTVTWGSKYENQIDQDAKELMAKFDYDFVKLATEKGFMERSFIS